MDVDLLFLPTRPLTINIEAGKGGFQATGSFRSKRIVGDGTREITGQTFRPGTLIGQKEEIDIHREILLLERLKKTSTTTLRLLYPTPKGWRVGTFVGIHDETRLRVREGNIDRIVDTDTIHLFRPTYGAHAQLLRLYTNALAAGEILPMDSLETNNVTIDLAKTDQAPPDIKNNPQLLRQYKALTLRSEKHGCEGHIGELQ